MTSIVQIGSASLDVLEFEGQRVVTLAMVDAVHERPEGTAGRNFRENRDRFIQTEDFFELTSDEIRRQSFGQAFPPRTPKGLVLTESGYLMLVKSFSDDLAWDVQRKLVKSYFRPTTSITIPRTLSEALRFAADQADAAVKALQERDHAIATKALIGNKREATAMATASRKSREAAQLRDRLGFNARHATVTAVEKATGSKFPKNVYVGLRSWCKTHGQSPVEVVDPRYGHVKAWPAAAWAAVHEIRLEDLFGEEVPA